jgi:hypothetical protein
MKDWRGYLLLAIDSSHIAPPPDAASREHCGAAGRELSAATARASALDVIVDASVERLAVGGRSLANTHVEALGGVGPDGGGRKPIVICDWRCPSEDFIKCLRDKERK